MNPKNDWQRLAAAARLAPDTRDTAAPPGFATRVAALAAAAESRPGSLFDTLLPRLSLRALCAGATLAVIAGISGYPAALKLFETPAGPSVALLSPVFRPAAADSPESPATGSPAAEGAAANPSAGDDPVAELVDIVS